MSYALVPLDGERLSALILDAQDTLAGLCDNADVIADEAADIAEASLAFYEAYGATAPWFSYLVRRTADHAIVGTCGFRGPPQGRIVEIAYYTFAAYTGQGCATSMVAGLLGLARQSTEVDYVVAHTLPHEDAATTILRRHGFEHVGVINDPEAGDFWRWVLGIGE